MNLNHTACCALGQICGIGNNTSQEEIVDLLEQLAHEQSIDWTPEHLGGQTAVFAVTTPSETKLAYNLVELGFKNVFEFPRRHGYPEGMLKLWVRQVNPSPFLDTYDPD